jgi:hypothetical protein
VFAKLGSVHMAEIGAKGFATLVARHFGGDRQAAIDYLHLQGAERKISDLLGKQMAATGETCVELPVLLDPDADPFFAEPAPTWRERVGGGGRGRSR